MSIMKTLSVKDCWILNDLPGSFAAGEHRTARANVRFPERYTCANSKPIPHMVAPPIKQPVRVSWSGARRFGDFNYTGDPFGIIVGQRVRRLVEENGLKGFVFRDVRFVQHKPLRDQAFAPEEVQGKFWALDAEIALSLTFGPSHPIEVKQVCDLCKWTEIAFPRKGEITLDFNGWDGHDAFRIKHVDCFGVSARFRRLVRSAQMTLIDFSPLSELGTEEARAELWGPVSKRLAEVASIDEQYRRRLADWNQGLVDEKYMNELLSDPMIDEDASKKQELLRRRAFRILRKSGYGYLD